MIEHRSIRRVRSSIGSPTLALVTCLSGCGDFLDNLIDVDAPSQLITDEYLIPGNAATILAGAIGDFECAFGRYVAAGAMLSDELVKSGNAEAWTPYDRRDNSTSGGLPGTYADATCDAAAQSAPAVYRSLSTARWHADTLRILLTTWSDGEVANRTPLLAEATVYAGYSTLLLGEAMCSAALDAGPELSPAEIFARAETRFTEALTAAQATQNSKLINMALVGRARTRLNLQRYTDAGTDAAAVPAAFVANATMASTPTRRQNFLFFANQQSANVSVEGMYRDFRTEGVPDPRVKVLDTGRNATPASPIRLWYQLKYPALDTPTPLASGDEARLILAEVRARAGDLAGARDIINALHTAAGLPPFAGGDQAATLQQIVWERRAELFLESHRVGDARRYNQTPVPAAGAPYPFGGTYGSQLCFPLPDAERVNNPNIG